MNKKVKERKKSFNLMMKPSVKLMGEKKALKKKLTLSQLVEILLYEYAE